MALRSRCSDARLKKQLLGSGQQRGRNSHLFGVLFAFSPMYACTHVLTGHPPIGLPSALTHGRPPAQRPSASMHAALSAASGLPSAGTPSCAAACSTTLRTLPSMPSSHLKTSTYVEIKARQGDRR